MNLQTDRFGNYQKCALSFSWILNRSCSEKFVWSSAVLGVNPVPPGTSWVALGKSLHLSESVFSPETYRQEYLPI